MTIAMRHVVKFPADVQATAGVEVVRSGGTYRFKLNYDELSPSSEVQSAALIAYMDPVTKAMGVTNLSAATNSNANIQSIAESETAADKVGYWNGSASYQLADFTSFARTLVASGDASAARSALGSVIGTDVQAYSANLDAFAGKVAPTGDVIGSSDTQTLTGKTIDGGDNTITNVPNSALNVGTAANQLVALDGTGKLPAIDGSQLTGLPGGGDMLKSSYDPGAIGSNAFDGYPIANRTTLAGLSTTAFTTAYLRETGREGTFLWNSDDLSTEVTADTGEGDFVPPSADTTGAGGAWQRVRKFGDLFKTSEYGDDIAKAMAACAARGGGTVEINTVGTLVASAGFIVPPEVSLVGLGSDKSTINFDNLTSNGEFASIDQGRAVGYWGILGTDANSGLLTELPAFTGAGIDYYYLDFSSAHGLVEDDFFIIENTANGSFAGYRNEYHDGEHNRVVRVDGLRVYTLWPLRNDYTYSSTVKAWKVSPRKGKIGGFRLDMSGATATGEWGGVKIFRGDSMEVDDISVYGADQAGVQFDQCLNIRATRIKAALRMDSGYSADAQYACAIVNSSKVVVSGAELSANWCAADLSGYAVPGCIPNTECGFEHAVCEVTYTHAAASMHGCSRDSFFRDVTAQGGISLGGLNSLADDCRVRVRRASNPVIYRAAEVVGGRHEIRNCRGYSNLNGGGDTSPTGAVYLRAESNAKSPVEFIIEGGNIMASAETRPIYIGCDNNAAVVSYRIENINVDFTSVDNDGMVVVRHTVGANTPGYAIQRGITGYAPTKPWAKWYDGYVATYMEMPRQKGTWSGTSTATTSMDSSITLPHAYPTGYPVGSSAMISTNNLGPNVVTIIRDRGTTFTRPLISPASGSFTSGVSFTVDWEAW